MGTYTYANGNRYDGHWLDDKRHGRGVFVCAEDGSVYDGEWSLGRKEGRGTLKMAQGHMIEATWKHGQIASVTAFQFAPDSPWVNPDL